ncbi:ferritin-like domain-containing protein [Spirosoma sp. HMF4905]|uniref:Ferritin-like domain-containing protein n=1 Tax=Spirosoma arboris TaxID=2682092 RepID=A0A7K1SAI6_9BACT|nr:ferritin-like domain-containing protein [Spirosoma arboris]MVM30834.1 ferritin-like domain-containing protein [Spirosoma arboris]
MNLFKLISDIEQVDPEFSERYSFYSRRNLLKFSSNLIAAGIPAIVAGTLNKALAQTTTPPSQAAIDVANFALTLEYLEDEFYRTGLGTSGLVPSTDTTVISQISKHETAHVALLKGALLTAAVPKPTFKFPAGTFTSYPTFLATARALEDTGVQAYKGQAPALINDKAILGIALQIHSVEARHASEVRRMLGLKGWVSDTTQTTFMQGTVNLKTLPNVSNISDDNLRGAFDEPLTKAQVLAIAAPFL